MKTLPIVFLVAFTAGLVLAVFAMLHGVEHTRPSKSRAPSPFFNLPALAAFAIGFGATGYPIASRTGLPAWGVLLIAAGAGALAISAMITLLAQWALRGVSAESLSVDDEIQGQLAIVSQDIGPSAPGEIRYDRRGHEVRIPAQSLSARSLAVGEEVVIDRIENGVAMVEEWSVVEQRI